MRRIARDGAIGEREPASIVGDTAAAVGGRIARDGAIGKGERAIIGIEDATAALAVGASRSIARDGTVGERERATEIGDAAAATRVARDDAVAQRERASIGDTAAFAVEASRRVARDDAVAQREPAFVVDEAVGCVAVLEGETENGNGCSLYHANSIPTLATADREHTCTWTPNRQVLRNDQITARQPNSSTQTSVKRDRAS